MEPNYEIITKEIPAKGKGYIFLKKCWPGQVGETLRRAAGELLRQGASSLYAASADPSAPLAEGDGEGYRLEYRHDMLGMECTLARRPGPLGVLSLEPLTRERGGAWLTIYNESFFDVPNSETYGREALESILGPEYRCGFALLDGVPMGIYECGFKKEHPEIGSIGLAKDYRGRGLGRELLLSVMDMLAGLGYEKAWLQVSTANQAAFSLYRSVGFVPERTLSRWYELIAEGDLLD